MVTGVFSVNLANPDVLAGAIRPQVCYTRVMPISVLRITKDENDHTWVTARFDEARLLVQGRPAFDRTARIFFTELREVRDVEAIEGLDDEFAVATISEPITSETLRSIPVTAMTSWANLPEVRERIKTLLAVEPVSTGGDVRNVRQVPVFEEAAPARRPPLRFRGAKERKKPPAFYEQIADAYRWLVHHDHDASPAERLRKENEVPVSTTHRWIKEARRRGLLGPGARGRAGQ
jgi:hypothetical protein